MSYSNSITGVDITKYGAIANNSADCTSAFATATTHATVDPSGKIYLPAGTYLLSQTQTITANLHFAPGATLHVVDGYSVTITGFIEAEDYQIIFNVDTGANIYPWGNPYISACWYGAIQAPAQSPPYSTAFIQQALNSSTTNYAGVKIGRAHV